MKELKYVTRGNSSPVGKPRVYFCAHDGDFATYLDPVARELVDICDCAVYYRSEGRSARDGEHLNDLLRMQLFVIPVTTKFLTEKSDALTYELKFAQENNIPLLPLIEERGLNELFEKVFGEIQYLDKNENADSGIGYDVKLKNYLSATLVGEELAERVRKAFDAYVFLSYRKKDRRYAEELMRLVHKDKELRDIAIWYDEFLTPGENFNDVIKSALVKSDLFLLAVTPNVVNEDNYIMRIEYPMAIEEKKTVLPAEMVKTDKKALEEKYKNIPSVVAALDGAQLKNSVLSSLKNLATRKNDSPEHNYFIGLAYLSGIDVEIDHERALSLITDSANAGLIEAIDRLISMYKDGNGVPRSYDKALEYQNKKINILTDEYNKSASLHNAEKLVGAYEAAGDLCRETYRFDEAKSFFTKGIEFVLQSKYQNELIRYRAVCADKLGNVYRSLGDIKEAKAIYTETCNLKKQILSKSNTPIAKRDLAIAYERLADVEMAEGNSDKALHLYNDAYGLNRDLCNSNIDAEARRGLAISLEKIADANLRKRNRFYLREKYEQANKIRLALVDELKNEQSWQYLAISYDKLGDLEIYENSVKDALKYYAKAHEIREKLVKEYDTVNAKRYLAVSYTRLAAVYGMIDEKKSNNYLDTAMNIRRDLLKKYNTIEQRRDLSLSYEWLGNAHSQKGNFSAAINSYLEAKKLREALVHDTETPSSVRDLAAICSVLCYAYVRLGNTSVAREQIEKQISLMEGLFAKYKGKEIYYELALAYEDAGLGFEMIQDYPKAKEAYRKAFVIIEELGRLGSEEDAVKRREKLAEIYVLSGDGKLEVEQRQAIVKIREDILAKTDEDSNYTQKSDLASALENLAAAFIRAGLAKESKDTYERAISLRNSNSQKQEAILAYEAASFACEAMGDANGAKKYHDAATNARRISEREHEFSSSRRSYSSMRFEDYDEDDGPDYSSVDCSVLGSTLADFDRVGTSVATLSKNDFIRGYTVNLSNEFKEATEYEQRGDTYKKAGKPVKAQKSYESAIETYTYLKTSKNVDSVRRPIYLLKEKLGDIAIGSGKNKEALRLYTESMNERYELAKTDKSARMTEDLATGHGCLGDAYRVNADHKNAADCYEKELCENLKLKKTGTTPKLARALFCNYDNLGNEYTALGNTKGVYENYKNAVEIYLTITEESKRDPVYLLDRYEKIGDECMTLGKPKEARTYYESSLAVRKELFEKKGTEENKTRLAIGYGCLGDALLAEGNFESAIKQFSEELALRLELCALKKTVDRLIDTAFAYHNRAVATCGRGEYKSAIKDEKRSISITKKLAKTNSNAKWYLRESYNQMAKIMTSLSKVKAATNFSEKAKKV